MFTRTLLQWKTRVSRLADIVGQIGSGSAFRFDTAIVDEFADETYRRLRGLATRKGFREFRVAQAKASLPTTAVSTDEQYATIAYPTGAIAVVGIDVLQSGRWRRLKHLDGWGERRDHQDNHPAECERPYAWDVISHGSVATTVLTAGTIGIFPVPTSGEYMLWSLPDWADIAGHDTYLFLYREQCWYDYHVAQGVLECCLRDNDAQRRQALAEKMSDDAVTAIGEFTGIETEDGVGSWTRDAANYHG
jgi:hypothetical protein